MLYCSGYSYPAQISWTDYADDLALQSEAITKLGALGRWPAKKSAAMEDQDGFVFRHRGTRLYRKDLSSPAFRSARTF